ncbi:MAG: RodZ domain-containing protein [Methylophilaceae bacterium]
MARKPKQTTESKKTTVSHQSDLKSNIAAIEAPPLNIELIKESLPEHFGAEYRSRCGGALRANREKQGLTTQEIASRLRLSSKQIEALEADNFVALPEATIVKGFIRNYAKVLKIAAEPLLDAYMVIVPEKEPQSFTLKPSVNMKVKEYERPNIKRVALIGILAVLGLVFWFFYQNYMQKPSPITPTAKMEQSEDAEPLPEAALPAAERFAEETVTDIVLPEANGTSVAAAATSADEQVASPTIVIPASEANAQTAPEVSPVQAESTTDISRLEFSASQETWISVTDTAGKEIYNKILFSGNREVLEAKLPLNVVVGNAHGATLIVNGKSIDLAPHTRINVARVKLD